jgi:hypothetical protein
MEVARIYVTSSGLGTQISGTDVEQRIAVNVCLVANLSGKAQVQFMEGKV